LAAPAQDEPDYDTPPDWIKKPTMEDVMSVWPADAMRTGRGGRAVIGCKVSAEGTLYDCAVVEEDPSGAGFGAAAVVLSRQLLMRPAMKDGKPVRGAKVRIPVTFPDMDKTTGSRTSALARNTLLRSVISNVPWTAAPTYAEVAAVYPAKARAKGVGGNVVLNCRINGEGRLVGCQTVRATPDDVGFGPAARELAKRFQGPTEMADGRSVAGSLVQVPFTFSPEMLDGGAPVIGKPQWAALPGGGDVTEAYPSAARQSRIGGRVTLNCAVAVGGKLEACQVTREEPVGQGFGAAAQRLAAHFVVGTWSPEGLPTQGGRVNVPLRFEPPTAEELAAEKGR
jgi:TonB family protein